MICFYASEWLALSTQDIEQEIVAGEEVAFLVQLNEKILLKQASQPLRICDIFTGQVLNSAASQTSLHSCACFPLRLTSSNGAGD